MHIYFAAPLFNQAERTFNLQVTQRLEAQGFAVFLPQRDGVEISQPPYAEMSVPELNRMIFTIDRDKVLAADIFLIVLDGRVPDEGACFELGLAYGQKHLLQQEKLLIGLQTDRRAAFLGEKRNAMLDGPLDHIAEDENSLIAALEAYRQARQQ